MFSTADAETTTDALLRELEAMSQERRELVIRNTARFWTAPLCSALVRHSFEARFASRSEMEAWARCAVLVAGNLGADDESHADAVAEAYINLGNVKRVQGDFRAAELAFERGRLGLASRCGYKSLELRNRHDSQLASLRVYQRRFRDAKLLLLGLVDRRRRQRDHAGETAALLQLGVCLVVADDQEAALSHFLAAMILARDASDLRARRLATQGIVTCFIDMGRPEEADSLWMDGAAVFWDSERLFRVRWDWQRGRIDLGLGRLPEALEHLSEVRDAYVSEGLGFEAGLASLDLAEAQVRAGVRLRALETLTTGLLLLKGIGAPRETLAAVSMLLEIGEGATLAAQIADVARRVRRLSPG